MNETGHGCDAETVYLGVKVELVDFCKERRRNVDAFIIACLRSRFSWIRKLKIWLVERRGENVRSFKTACLGPDAMLCAALLSFDRFIARLTLCEVGSTL